MKVNVAIVNAFVDAKNGGNPAGVVLDADKISDKQKLKIAKQVGLSETAFVSKSEVADFKLDFFTPDRQIAHCGHATVATFSYLSQQGLLQDRETSKETIDGVRKIEMIGKLAFMEQRPPTYTEVIQHYNQLPQALGVTPKTIIGVPLVVNTGNSFLLVEVPDLQQLEQLQPDFDLISQISETYDLIGFYVFTRATNQKGRDASTRMFAPRYGINEESATGMAAGPLACYLYDVAGVNKPQFLIEQGYSMQLASPSCIDVRLSLDQGNIQSISAGGVGIESSFLQIEI